MPRNRKPFKSPKPIDATASSAMEMPLRDVASGAVPFTFAVNCAPETVEEADKTWTIAGVWSEEFAVLTFTISQLMKFSPEKRQRILKAANEFFGGV